MFLMSIIFVKLNSYHVLKINKVFELASCERFSVYIFCIFLPTWIITSDQNALNELLKCSYIVVLEIFVYSEIEFKEISVSLSELNSFVPTSSSSSCTDSYLFLATSFLLSTGNLSIKRFPPRNLKIIGFPPLIKIIFISCIDFNLKSFKVNVYDYFTFKGSPYSQVILSPLSRVVIYSMSD